MLSSTSPGLPFQVPKPRTRLVGREQAIESVSTLLRQEATRLLTLVGPGGSGKTRLAIVAAATSEDAFPDGTVFVPLDPVNDPARVLQTVAAALQVAGQSDEPVSNQLVSAIGQHRMLLVLDNLEHVVDAAPDIGQLLEGCPNLTLLTTSRTPLRLYGERVFPVPPLPCPNPTQSMSPAELQTYGAVALFVDRVRDINPEFTLTETNAGNVAEICSYLDGLPLAIELTAARTRYLSLPAIIERLERSLDLLTGGAVDLPARQRTLRNTIGWSYQLLQPAEQVLLQYLGVFRGGWVLEAVEKVAGASVNDAASALEQLIDHSLVQFREADDGSPRYLLHETIREFALEQLEQSGHAKTARRRHADYFTTLADEAERQRHRGEEIAALDLISRDYDNMCAALDWLYQHREVEQGLLLAEKLGWFCFNRRSMSEGRAHVQAFVDLSDPERPTRARTLALLQLSWLASFQANPAVGIHAAEEALANVQASGNRELLPRALDTLGVAVGMGGDYERACVLFQQTATVAREVGDQPNLVRALNNLAVMADVAPDLNAVELLEEALLIARATGVPATIALVLSNLAGVVRRESRDRTRAIELNREALLIYRDSGNTWGLAGLLDSTAHISLAVGCPRNAAQLAGAAAALRERINTPIQPIILAEHEQLIADLRAALDADFEPAWAAGTQLSLDEAVQLALAVGDRKETESAADLVLSKREVEVVKLLAEGRSNQEISTQLFISPHTAAHHVTSILNKLGVDSRTAAAAWAIKHGLA